MMHKKLSVNMGPDGQQYAMRLDADEMVYQTHREQGGINSKANEKALQNLAGNTYRLYMHMIMKPMSGVSA